MWMYISRLAAQAAKAKPSMLSLEMLEKINPTREPQTILVGSTAPWISNWLMFVMVRLILSVIAWQEC